MVWSIYLRPSVQAVGIMPQPAIQPQFGAEPAGKLGREADLHGAAVGHLMVEGGEHAIPVFQADGMSEPESKAALSNAPRPRFGEEKSNAGSAFAAVSARPGWMTSGLAAGQISRKM